MDNLPESVEYIQTIVVDINGRPVGKMFPVEKLQSLLRNKDEVVSLIEYLGPNFELPHCLTHLSDQGFPNQRLVPDHSSLRVCPWSGPDYSLAMVFCDTYDVNSEIPGPMNPRLIARKCLGLLKTEMGLEFMLGVENEFKLLHSSTKEPIGRTVHFMDSFFQCTEVMPFMRRMRQYLLPLGVVFDSWNMEYGLGQLEVPLAPSLGLAGPDSVFLFKMASRFAAKELGMDAVFMSASLGPGDLASGAHFNHSLWWRLPSEDNEASDNAMHCETNPSKLSETGEHWLAGLITHSRALTAFASPTISCYRRIVKSAWAPDQASWHYSDRLTGYRVKTSAHPDPAVASQMSTYIENRLPTSAANSYLVVASMIVAGMDGVRRKLSLPAPGNGDHCHKLPRTLAEALDALQEDEVMVEGLGFTFVDHYIRCKKLYEVEPMKDVDLYDSTKVAIEKEMCSYYNL